MNGWRSLLDCTERMLDAARNGAFDRVAELEGERQTLLAGLPPVGEADRGILIKVLELGGEIARRVDTARAQAAERVRLARQAQAGAGAYLGVAFGR